LTKASLESKFVKKAMKRRGVIILLLCIFAFSCMAQPANWWELKYGVKKLEDIGVEKLKEEQFRMKELRTIGIVLIPVGLATTAFSLDQIGQAMFSKDGGEGLGLLLVAGVGSVITGTVVILVSYVRLYDIERALAIYGVSSKLNISPDHLYKGQIQGIQFTVRCAL